MRRTISICALLTILLASTAAAQNNNTVRSWDAYWGEYFAAHLGSVGQSYLQNMIRNGYTIYQRTSDWRLGDPPVTISQTFTDLQLGYGWWMSNTHTQASSTTLPCEIYGSVVEVYPPTSQGLADRRTAYDAYRADSRYRDYVLTGENSAGYYIVMRPTAYRDKFYSWDTAVINACCLGHAYNDYWPSARLVLDFNFSVTNTEVKSCLTTMFTRMNGDEGIDKRAVLFAIQGTQFSFTGNLNTVLTPVVTSITSLPAQMRADAQVAVTFDCDMDDHFNTVIACGSVDVDTPIWPATNRLTFWVCPRTTGAGTVEVLPYDTYNAIYDGIRSSNGIGFDGDAIGPNRNTKFLSTVSLVDNPAASVAWFRAVRYPDGVHAEWKVESQDSTDRYVVERADDRFGPFTPIATILVDHQRSDYVVVDPCATDCFYQLVEYEVGGCRLVQGFDGVSAPPILEPEPTASALVADSLMSSANQQYPSLNSPTQILPIYGVTYITKTAWIPRLTPRVNKLNALGYVVNVEGVESFGATASARQAGIIQYIEQGLPNGLWAVCLVGADDDSLAWDSLPWYDWSKPTWPYNPAQNVIPTFFIPEISHVQSRSQSWYTPYGNTDQLYGAAPDSTPRLVVTRVPATTADEVTYAVAKADAYESLDLSRGTVAVFAQGLDLSGNSGARALQQANAFAAKVPSARYTVKKIYDTPSTNYTYAQRQTLFVSTVSPTDPTNRVVAMSFHGTMANRNQVHWQQASLGGSWGLLPAGSDLCAVLANYCEYAGTSRRKDPSAGRGFSERAMTLYYDRGPALIIGANCGTFQPVNGVLDSIFADIVYRTGAKSGPHAWLMTMQKALMMRPTDVAWKHAILTTGSIGFPETPWPGMIVNNTTDVRQSPGVASRIELTITPNPSRHPTIRFAVPLSAVVQLEVYDVTGRRVSQVVNNQMSPGVYTARLGERLSPGLYFARLRIGTVEQKERMVILH